MLTAFNRSASMKPPYEGQKLTGRDDQIFTVSYCQWDRSIGFYKLVLQVGDVHPDPFAPGIDLDDETFPSFCEREGILKW